MSERTTEHGEGIEHRMSERATQHEHGGSDASQYAPLTPRWDEVTINRMPAPERTEKQKRTHQLWLRILAILSALFGLNYVVWRWMASVNWDAWWIAVPLIVAESYSFIDTLFFGMAIWRIKERPRPTVAAQGTVDVFVTTYDEPIPLVMATAHAAKAMRYPHSTWILDDGRRDDLRAEAERAGIGYITRSAAWKDKPRHAKAGNLNGALFQTDGEFLMILDADQIPEPQFLDRVLPYFAEDDTVAVVQTPQFFVNVDDADPLGSQAPLFYGPIQQGKDGWNAAFFCGSNAMLRREALMQLGIVGYVRTVTRTVTKALRTADRVLAKAAHSARTDDGTAEAVATVRAGVDEAKRMLAAGASLGEVTYRIQKAVDDASRAHVQRDLEALQADLAAIRALPIQMDAELGEFVVDDAALDSLASREWTPLGAIESVQAIARVLNVDRADEAQAVMPMSTMSVTEDMATAMNLHSMGWKSVYHHESMVHGLAPEDLATMLKQRLRWAQGTIQVLLRDNPLVKKGLSVGQRVMYFATMWSYLAGFAAVIYLAAPMVYLVFGILPVHAWSLLFFLHFLPYFIVNQIMFIVVGRGVKTWRGQQYALALFPIWIRSVTTAVANVVFKRPLEFAVTPKTHANAYHFPLRLVWPQLTAMVLLIIAGIIGIGRVIVGTGDGTGTAVNTAWVVYDVVVLSVILQAALFRGPKTRSPIHPDF